jgi:hypothetical protein
VITIQKTSRFTGSEDKRYDNQGTSRKISQEIKKSGVINKRSGGSVMYLNFSHNRKKYSRD